MFSFTKEKMAPQREGSTHEKKWSEWMGGKDRGSWDEEEQNEPPSPSSSSSSRHVKEGILSGHEADCWKFRNEEGNILYLIYLFFCFHHPDLVWSLQQFAHRDAAAPAQPRLPRGFLC